MKITDATRHIADALQVGSDEGPVTVTHVTQVERDKVLVSVNDKLYLLVVEEVESVFFDYIPPVDMMGNTEGDLHEG